MSDNDEQQQQLLDRIATSRNLAEELLREMPDMKDEIEMELKEAAQQLTEKTPAIKSEADLSPKTDTDEKLITEESNMKVVALIDEQKTRKREGNMAEIDKQLCGLSATKQIKIEHTLEERKSIIEAHISNDTASNDAKALEDLERIRKLKEQTIIALDQLEKHEEKLLRAEAIAKQLQLIGRDEREEPKKPAIKLEMLTSSPVAKKEEREENNVKQPVVDEEKRDEKAIVNVEENMVEDKTKEVNVNEKDSNDVDMNSKDIENGQKAEQNEQNVHEIHSSEAVNAAPDQNGATQDNNSVNAPIPESAAAVASISLDESNSQSASAKEVVPELPPEQLTPEEEAYDQQLRASRAAFLQHLPCFKLPDTNENNVEAIPRCRECRRRNASTPAPPSDVYCRFYEFRRLQYNETGELKVAGFPNPYTDPTPEDSVIWQPDKDSQPTAGWMDIQVCRYILLHVGDQFCYLWRQEAEALKLHENPNTTIAWKKVVQGIREICDVCDTTLFNYHWTCNMCGFGVCLDCFKDRKEQRSCRRRRTGDKPQRGHDEFHWMLCTATGPPHLKHELRDLMLTQIIAGDALNVLGRLVHDVRALWQVPQVCGCLLSKQQLPVDSELSALIQDMIKESQLKQQTSASSLATEETLRKQARMEQVHAKKLEFARARGIDYVPGRQWTKQTLGKDPITSAFDNFKHINFLRKGLAGLRRFLPPRAMTLAQSTLLAPGVPHERLCDGKLLRLTDATHPDNRILFQEVWKCGQPVIISEVQRSLNLDLWRPEAFCKDFGDKPNDLINCLNGNLVPNQPMRHFWEGFQCIKKRLLDHNGKPMLLKLKDWPPGDDFAEILPTRYADLMKGLPMPEYTLRTGNLNIASCLPKMFVPPDLGPKMYNAYGSAFHPDKGTTNLHLDISDAANIMVYVGIPQDTDSKRHRMATQHAIALGGCDYITRARSQSPNVVPGALWHIFPARDADKIRDLLNRVTLEKGFRLEPDHDPIHDQNWYLDDKLRARLFKEYGVEGYPIVQCLGDTVFIPAGAPHQVQNLHNCIKVAEDFVSPENITHCYHLTHEFRRLSHSHTNHEDKLQIKNIIYHAIKDCCHILMLALDQRIDDELEKEMQLQKNEKAKLNGRDEGTDKSEGDQLNGSETESADSISLGGKGQV